MGDDFYFKARFSWSKSFEQLDDQELASLTRAIWLMGEYRENSDPTGKAAVVWPLIRADIEHDLRDRDNGRKGGRPPKDKNQGLNPGLKGGFNPPYTENSTENQDPENSIYKANQNGKGHPSLNLVRMYCVLNHLSVDADAFWNHFEENGWKDRDGNPVRDWAALLKSWNEKSEESKAKTRDPDPVRWVG